MAQSREFDGSNPLRSVVSAHSASDTAGPHPFVSFVDLETDGARRIRKRRGRQLVGTLPETVKAIHEFDRVDPTTGLTSRHILVATIAGIYRYAGGTSFTPMTLPFAPTGTAWGFLNFANRCFAWNGADPAIVFDGTSWRKVGIAPPAVAPQYILTGIYTVGSMSANLEQNQVHGTVPAMWHGGMAQKRILINGIGYRVSTVDVFGDGVSVPPALTLTENFHQATAVGLPYEIHEGVMDWIRPPFYGFTYRNPTTGHESDLSPTLEITQHDQYGVTPQITIPGSAQNTAAYAEGYTEIALYRSPAEGSELRRVNVTINNRNDGLAIVFTETSVTCRDTALLDTIAPRDSNREPPPAFVSMAAWMGRLWGLLTRNDIGRAYFSALNEELPVGRGEESYPRRFNRYGMPKPVGMLSVGSPGSKNGLIIQAADGDYTLEGYDNFTFTPPYRLTRRSGGFTYGAIDVGGTLVQLYRDKHLYQDNIDIGGPVQNKLDAINAAEIEVSRLHGFEHERDNLLLVSFPRNPAVVNDYTLVIDYKAERINEWAFGFAAIATTHTAISVAEVAVGIGSAVWRLLKDVYDDNGATYAPTFRIAPLRFPTRKILRRVELFVGPAASAPEELVWALNYRIDEDPVGVNVTFTEVPEETQSAAGRALVWQPGDPIIFNTIDCQVTFPETATELYAEKLRLVFDDAQTSEDDAK